ncbi:basic phospholipase A2 Sms-N6-like [Eublepharis macularius]|uniref:Phospholipase A2 n=1 Tax=Eublepharis macularius TaxID=481883 RepID=A0AA97LJ40_EUBMA|nr:basic phospholipase A2 Sms-N6-like [Eublepharis macularius]
MKILLGAIVLLACSVLIAQGNLLDFGKMIKQVTGKNPVPDYTTYGCYCGKSGKGQPKDATDRCCLVHDCCYTGLTGKCQPHFQRYTFTYQNGTVTCDEGSWCAVQTCECDKAAAFCMQDNLSSYDKKLRFYSNTNCEGPKEC